MGTLGTAFNKSVGPSYSASNFTPKFILNKMWTTFHTIVINCSISDYVCLIYTKMASGPWPLCGQVTGPLISVWLEFVEWYIKGIYKPFYEEIIWFHAHLFGQNVPNAHLGPNNGPKWALWAHFLTNRSAPSYSASNCTPKSIFAKMQTPFPTNSFNF